MKIPSIISSISKKTVNLVKRTNVSKTIELATDIAEIPTRTKSKSGIKKLLLGLDKKTIKRLEELPTGKFLEEAQKLIITALDMPEELCPMVETHVMPENLLMQFTLNHKFFANKKCEEFPKPHLFSAIRHEMKHCEQNLAVLRTEDLGENAVNQFSSILARVKANLTIEHYRDMHQCAIQKLRDEKKMPESGLLLIEKIRQIPSEDKQSIKKVFDVLYNHDFKTYYKDLSDIRAKAIAKYGVIKAGSRDAIKTKKYFNGFCRTCEDNSGFKYWTSKHEIEAYTAGFGAKLVYLYQKFFG